MAAEIIEAGKALLAAHATRPNEVEAWQRPALNVLRYLGADGYETREERHAGFVEWAAGTFSERARKHNIRLTLDALEEAVLAEDPRELPRPSPPAHAPDEVFSDAWTAAVEEEKRVRLVEAAAKALGVAMPQTIKWSASGGAYDPTTDTLWLPDRTSGETPDELKATAGHELQHKVQAEAGPRLHAYSAARGSLERLARELITPDDSLPIHLRATTMLAGASAYATFVLLGKTVGYQQELDADNASARVASPGAAINSLRKGHAAAQQRGYRAEQGKTWAERVALRVSRALEDDHPTLQARIDNLRRQEDDPERTR